MESNRLFRKSLVLLLALSPSDGSAVVRAMAEAGIATKLCGVGDLSNEVQAGFGAIVLAEEAMSEQLVRKLAALIEEQPIWSDIPLVILTRPKREVSTNWGLIRNDPSNRNATFLERPMRIATLLQAVKVALRGREKQYQLREQICEREQLLAFSKRNEQLLSAVLNNTRMAVFFTDAKQNCIFLNAAAKELTGYALTEIQGRSLYETLQDIHPDGRPYPLQDCPIDRAFSENVQPDGEEVFVHKDGHFYPVAFTASPIRQSNAVVGTVLEVRDITQRKAHVARLHMMMNELNHRVKNTLATVQSIFLQTMQSEGILDPAKERVMSRLGPVDKQLNRKGCELSVFFGIPLGNRGV